jgi:hypothetical protein
MKPMYGAILFATALLLTNLAVDLATGGEPRPFLSLLVGAVVGGLVFGLVLHWFARRKPQG